MEEHRKMKKKDYVNYNKLWENLAIKQTKERMLFELEYNYSENKEFIPFDILIKSIQDSYLLSNKEYKKLYDESKQLIESHQL
jgi:hypothetical protein